MGVGVRCAAGDTGAFEPGAEWPETVFVDDELAWLLERALEWLLECPPPLAADIGQRENSTVISSAKDRFMGFLHGEKQQNALAGGIPWLAPLLAGRHLVKIIRAPWLKPWRFTFD